MKEIPPNNVVAMNHFGRPGAILSQATVAILNDCRDLAGERLLVALSSMMGVAVHEFFELAEKSLSFEVRNIYMDALGLARDKRSVIELGFKTQFTQAFNKEARGEKNTPAAQHTTSISELEFSLVEPDELEESLASINIANNIHTHCSEELFGLERRMGALLNDPELEHTNNPLGPELIASAFMDTLKELPCTIKVKLLLVMLFNKHMPEQIKTLYQDINQRLAEKGILPKIRVGLRKRPRSSSSSVAPSGEGGGPIPGAPISAEQGMFSTLQQLMTHGGNADLGGTAYGGGGSGGAAQSGPGMGSGSSLNAAAQSAHAMDALTKLQHGQIEGVFAHDSKFNVASLSDGHTNVLHELKAAGVASGMGHMDAMTLDIVAMLFDYILDDRRIPDAMKALIGRLQIPVLKVAMLDKSFFSQKSHPARKLLDKLAEVSIGWNDSEGHQSGLYKKVDSLVQRILNEFSDKVGIFAEALEDLNEFIVEEKQQTDQLTGVSAQVIQQQEQAEVAAIMAHDEVQRRVQSQRLPQTIRNFLFGCWKSVLAAGYNKAGEESDVWNQDLETMDQLAWSIAPKKAPEERKKLVGLLPGLLMRLQRGMTNAGVPDVDRDQFFADLVKYHAEAVKAGLHSKMEDSLELAPSAEEMAAEAAVSLNTDVSRASADFMEIVPPALVTAPDPVLLQAIAEPEDETADLKLKEFRTHNSRWEIEPDADADDYDLMVKRLKRGNWIEFEQEDGSQSRVKLAWVSPLKGVYLFTNRLGERAVSITPAGLAEKLRIGNAQIIDDLALVDRAVNNLMERLQQPAVSAA